MQKFNQEEINLICVFDTSSRNALLTELSGSFIHIDEPEMRELMGAVIGKLNAISDDEFDDIGFYPTFMD